MFNSRISEAEKTPNILQISAMKESNILLVLSVSLPETLVKPISIYSTSVFVPPFNRDEPVMNGCSELASYFSCYYHCCTVCYEILTTGRFTRSPHPALVNSEFFPFHLYSVIGHWSTRISPSSSRNLSRAC